MRKKSDVLRRVKSGDAEWNA